MSKHKNRRLAAALIDGGSSFEEIGKAIGVSPQAARQIYLRAVTKLRRGSAMFADVRELLTECDQYRKAAPGAQCADAWGAEDGQCDRSVYDRRYHEKKRRIA